MLSAVLDALRALSAQAVLIGHFAVHFGISDSPFIASLPSLGVLFFFLLSGYLITHSALSKGRSYGFRNYFIDRFSRVYVPLLPVLFLTAAIMPEYVPLWYTQDTSRYTGSLLTALLLFYDNPILSHHLPDLYIGMNLTSPFFGANLPLWSLSIEWWFYMCFGLFFFQAIRNWKWFHWLLALPALSYVVGFILSDSRAGPFLTIVWIVGALLTLVRVTNAQRHYLWSLLIFGLLLTGIGMYRFSDLLPFAACSVFVGLAGLFRLTQRKVRSLGIFHFPAKYSYSLYLVHYPLMLFLAEVSSASDWFNFIFGVFISNLIAIAFYALFERHHRKLRSWLRRSFVHVDHPGGSVS